MKISYIDEVNAFERWLETNYLSTGSQLLWYKLIALFNRAWWNEWVTVDNRRLMTLTQVNSEATFIKMRDSLIDAELLQYQKGKKGSPNRYKMNFLTSKNEVQSEVQTAVNNAVQIAVQSEVQTAVIKRQRQRQEKDKDIKKTYTKKAEYVSPNVYPEDMTAQIEEIIALYNRLCFNMPKALEIIHAKRERAIAELLAKYSKEDFEIAFRKANESSFLCGCGKSGWIANLDWIIKPERFTQLLEGNFDDNGKDGTGVHAPTSYDLEEIDKFWDEKVPSLV